jgi:uncharacterized protein YyaL (SSP411 family)
MANALAQSTSPYLRQHADNPVDWHPWEPAALAQAKDLDKPILLSIGYSACHWCHVMAHESFEDEATAAVMNEHFINIKVDREERPDLDRIYQLAHQMLTRRGGGWPLTVFIDPQDLTPFFAGTYFPDQARHGLPAFAELLLRISSVFRSRRDTISEQNYELRQAMQQLNNEEQYRGALALETITAAVERIAQNSDTEFGGMGGAPKFPRPGDVRFLLQQSNNGGARADQAQVLALQSLDAMAQGGLYDHLGGGFYRYCVDQDWTIPHFEKMLYDNAQLIDLYAEAIANHPELAQKDDYRSTIEHTIAWAQRELWLDGQGFAASLDADSVGGEGAYYVWQKDEVSHLLNEAQYQLIEQVYGLKHTPNFEGHAWHLRRSHQAQPLSQALNNDELIQLQQGRECLLHHRQQRPAPDRDYKILTAWNALMIHGLARSGRLLSEERYLDLAEKTLEHLLNKVWQAPQLFAVHSLGQTHTPALLEDHVYLLWALMELLQSRFKTEYLALAQNLAKIVIDEFHDAESGGFFMTPHQHEALISRPKPYADDALPAGNAIAISALWQLGQLLGQQSYLDAAEQALRSGWSNLDSYPLSHTSLLHAADQVLRAPLRILLTGPLDAQGPWRRQLARLHQTPVYSLPNSGDLPAELSHYQDYSQRDSVHAFICQGTQCSAPIDNLTDLKQQICALVESE